MKRIGIFLLVNMLVLTTIIIITSLLGVNRYIDQTGAIMYYELLIFAAVIGFGGSIISLFISKWMAKKMMNVRVLDPNDRLNSQESQLVNTVHRLAQQAGINKMPEVGIYPSSEINAFATGPSRNNSLIAVSQGLLSNMNRDAVEGVLAHEVAHVANGDMVTMTLIQGVINTFVVFLSRIFAYIASTFVRREMAGIVHFLSIIVFQILLSILGSIAVMAFSRHREYAADYAGAQLAGKQKMLKALKSLQGSVHKVDTDQEAIQTFKINGGKKNARKAGIRELFSTHPDLEDRIRRLENRK
ncbi:Protease HtpX [Candidatus Syntrophocurvum alkaliphilum]|uniref:Protease HtpX homolog n=1 Tax=Candidatus Syntrophocurvum alkaliphilum TaxID=2293317 RepID=A0A6I6DDK2_9FIRM|nr:protease HtpX [Candidatus Syntrophocurvum alkaliphilum]QGT98661.1 Protease HtpX [Candidatus Syntrophocurvum alkaliphilum]